MGFLSDSNPDAFERQRAQQRDSFEETVIKKMLSNAGVAYRLSASRADASAMNGGQHRLTFDWFMRTYSRFPVHLGAARLTMTHRVTCGELFGSHFMKLPFVKEYQKFGEQLGLDPRNDRFGLIFNWAGIDAGGNAMVVHNYPLNSHLTPDPDSRVERGTKIVRPFGNPVVVYVVESLSDLLISTGNGWATE